MVVINFQDQLQAGTFEHFGVQDEVDLYFGTFAKAMAGIGGFVAAKANVIKYLQYNLRSSFVAFSMFLTVNNGASFQ